MAKLTPQDYVNAKEALEKVGFMAIKSSKKTISKFATDYNIGENVVELVRTTGSYNEYQTISRLEKEREGLVEQLEEAQDKPRKPRVTPWHYAIAVTILLGVIWLGIVGVIQIINWVGGLL